MLPSHCGLKLRPRPSLGRSRICRGCCEDLQLKRQRRACTFQHWREMSHTFPHVLLHRAMWGQIGPTNFMRDVRTIRPDLRNPISILLRPWRGALSTGSEHLAKWPLPRTSKGGLPWQPRGATPSGMRSACFSWQRRRNLQQLAQWRASRRTSLQCCAA